jgi:DNA-binding NarL/FixJ family response regulator
MLEAVRTLLDDRFDAVVMVANERSLLESIAKLMPELVIVDVSLPRDVGRNFVAVLHDQFPDLSMIALSAFNDKSVAEQLLTSGAVGVVLKSSAVTDLGPAMDAAESGKQFISPAINKVLGSIAIPN